MALIVRLLGAGRTNAGGNSGLYTVSSPALAAIVDNVRFVDPSGVSVTVNLFFKPNGGSQIRIWDRDKALSANGTLVVKPELTMAPGDAIEVTTSAGIDFVVSGVEKI